MIGAQHQTSSQKSCGRFQCFFFKRISRWWQLKDFVMFTPKIAEDSHFDSYFSSGLVQPPTRFSFIIKCMSLEIKILQPSRHLLRSSIFPKNNPNRRPDGNLSDKKIEEKCWHCRIASSPIHPCYFVDVVRYESLLLGKQHLMHENAAQIGFREQFLQDSRCRQWQLDNARSQYLELNGKQTVQLSLMIFPTRSEYLHSQKMLKEKLSPNTCPKNWECLDFFFK